jgi:hypothetical protein
MSQSLPWEVAVITKKAGQGLSIGRSDLPKLYVPVMTTVPGDSGLTVWFSTFMTGRIVPLQAAAK